MLTFNELSKRRGAQDILTDISFQAKPGRVTGFLGPNGAGKSSTLRILLGLDSATSGTALVDGRDFRTLRDPLRRAGLADYVAMDLKNGPARWAETVGVPEADPAAMLTPTVMDGVRGVKFIEAAVESSRKGGAWVRASI